MGTSAVAEQPEVVAASFRASERIFAGMGAHLFSEFCRHVPDDAEMVELASHAMAGARPAHLFSAVHYLLLGDFSDPLARYFGTLCEAPLPPEGAYPELARFCREHRPELLELLQTRSVQTTYAERCRAILPPMTVVARAAGEPLNLVEVGCSAGVLLAFDKFAYRLNTQGRIGAPEAPLVLQGELRGGPELFIPRIGKRAGIDLHILDARSDEDRRWLLALCFPELRKEQQNLAAALDVIAETDIAFYEGDGLAHLADALADAPDPLCVFHSACLFYWPLEARKAFEKLLLEHAATREFWRIAIEPSDTFDDWQKGQGGNGAAAPSATKKSGEIRIMHYCDGQVESRAVGAPDAEYGCIEWYE